MADGVWSQMEDSGGRNEVRNSAFVASNSAAADQSGNTETGSRETHEHEGGCDN